VQQGDAIALFLRAARTARSRWRRRSIARCATIAMPGASSRRQRRRLRVCFDRQTAERLIRYPLINAGVFRAQADAPHWQGWAELLGERCSARPT
jgi:hypothetical protein